MKVQFSVIVALPHSALTDSTMEVCLHIYWSATDEKKIVHDNVLDSISGCTVYVHIFFTLVQTKHHLQRVMFPTDNN